MLKYLIIQLDDTSPSFCHYSNNKTEQRLIGLETLKNGLMWAMKENLMIQFVYPDYELPEEYLELIDSVDHADIGSSAIETDVSVFDGCDSLSKLKDRQYAHVLLRLSKNELFERVEEIKSILGIQPSVNIVVTDLVSFEEKDFEIYNVILENISSAIIEKMKIDANVDFNLLTHRLLLGKMNNCNAGDENITLAPDGNFYICPAYYIEGEDNVGNPESGLVIPNAHLYKLHNAPICRNCDAYQCRRCVWLNQKTTLEVNTPSHEQCVVAHLERNASRRFLEQMRELKIANTNISIPEIDYLDPFDKIAR